MPEEEAYMQRCLDLASHGAGTASPNPMVGALIVEDDRILAEGFHYSPGHPHAEAAAIDRLPENIDLSRATLYVNLEPCCHEGRTPPCTERILKAGIGKVVFGSYDPSDRVAGRGIERLREGGCEVIGPVMEEECRTLNRRFLTAVQKKRPYVILKWARTLDGFIDRDRRSGEVGVNWITGIEAQRAVHRWRAEEDAILVGKGTLLQDDPSLTVRLVEGEDPLRVLIDRKGVLPRDLQALQKNPSTLVFTEAEEAEYPAPIEKVLIGPKNDLLQRIMKELHARDQLSLIVEGGSKILNAFIRNGLWDEARVLIGDRWFGQGKGAPRLQREPISEEWLGNDRLLTFKKDAG